VANRRTHSKVDDLPQEKQEELNRLLIEGSTYEEISAHFKNQGIDLSKSGVGRYGKGFIENVRRLRIIEDQSRTLISDAGGDGLVLDEAGGKLMAQTIIEMIQAGTVAPKNIPGLAIALAQVIKANVSREKFKSDMQGKVVKTADAVSKIAKKGGLTDDAAAQIRAKILGIAK
jgi:hypothetical protein